ncbi:MAG: hypothetical protein WBA68_07875 [Alteraurantiacibacter sp.]
MKRTIITPPALPPEALDELKQWLAITSAREDAALAALLRAALETCEGFTRAMLLEAQCEEVLPATRGWHLVATSPVRSITGVEALAEDGTRVPVDPAHYVLDIQADGAGRVNLLRAPDVARMIVTFTAGLAAQWNDLPDSLRHGVIRLAAHHYRERNEGGTSHPPSAVAALWQPWRQLRVA